MTSEQLQAWIKKCEALKLQSYVDTTGHLTIGWGRNLENGISLDEAELMFQNDLKRSTEELKEQPWFSKMPEGVQQALINMNFNLGIYKFLGFKKMVKALQERDFLTASIEALDSRWAKQVKSRATDISMMIREGK